MSEWLIASSLRFAMITRLFLDNETNDADNGQ